VAGINVNHAHASPAGLRIKQLVERENADVPVFQADHAPTAQLAVLLVGEQEANRPVAQRPRVVDVERDGRSAAQLVSQRHFHDGYWITAAGKAVLDLILQDGRKRDVPEAKVAVLVSLHFHAGYRGDLFEVQLLRNALSDHRQTVLAPHHPSLQNRGLQHSAQVMQPEALSRKLLGDDAQRGACGLANG